MSIWYVRTKPQIFTLDFGCDIHWPRRRRCYEIMVTLITNNIVCQGNIRKRASSCRSHSIIILIPNFSFHFAMANGIFRFIYFYKWNCWAYVEIRTIFSYSNVAFLRTKPKTLSLKHYELELNINGNVPSIQLNCIL